MIEIGGTEPTASICILEELLEQWKLQMAKPGWNQLVCFPVKVGGTTLGVHEASSAPRFANEYHQ